MMKDRSQRFQSTGGGTLATQAAAVKNPASIASLPAIALQKGRGVSVGAEVLSGKVFDYCNRARHTPHMQEVTRQHAEEC